ncbi:MAG: polysulfide reductase NrfD [Chloroflexi bacterium]|nr:polysulfide reductase NrfD [Chloroflexota bacterium]
MASDSPFGSAARVNDDILRPVLQTTWRFYAVVALLGSVVLWGAFAVWYLLSTGIGVFGLNRPVYWALMIINFVFFVGLSHSGTLISAILRVTHAEWRRPITRGAEAMTVFTIMVAAAFPLIHLGRPWVFYYLIPYPDLRGLWPNFRSPLIWDFIAISTYLTGSIIYLYLPMIPDLAVIRDRSHGWRRYLYIALSLGWTGSEREWSRLSRVLGIMAVVIIPVAVSVHSIVSWDFAMTIVPVWHSTIFAPYFVVGAIYSGIALVITIMVLIRWVFNLQSYLQPRQFDNLGKLLFVMSVIWFYFWFADALTTWYGREPSEFAVLRYTILGPFAPLFWTMIVCNLVIPFWTMMFKQLRRNVLVMLVVSLLVNVGMYSERILIIVPALSRGRLPSAWGSYQPTWVEISITAAAFAGFSLLYVLFTKFFPVVSMWEVKEGMGERAEAGVKEPGTPPRKTVEGAEGAYG